MTLVLIVSILIRLAAAVRSAVLQRRMRDWRMGILTLTLLLMAYRQCVALLAQPQWWPPTTKGIGAEWPGLVVSLLAFFTVAYLARLFTERIRAEAALRRSNRALKVISECNQVLVRAGTEAELLQEICRLLVDQGGYRLAWVGFTEQDDAKSVRPVAQAGFEAGYLDKVNITWADSERGRGPTGTAIRTGAPCIARNIPADPAYGPWRAEAIQRGYASSVALPLPGEEGCLGALMLYAAEPDAFDAGELALLTEMAGDLAYGIRALRTRFARQQAELLVNGQNKVLELIAAGTALPETLTALVRFIEAQAPGMLGSILLLDEDGVHVRHGAAPSLPAEFVAAVDDQPIGPSAGSCGTAAYRKEAVFVEDIATDPLWAVYRAAALPHGLRACWSTPIFDEQEKVLGTFAMYYPQPGRPQPEHRRLLDVATHIAAIAISRHRDEATLRAKTEELDHYFTNSLDLLCIADTGGYFRRLNPEWERTLGYPLNELEGRRFLDLVHPDDMAATLAAVEKLSSQEHVLNFSNRYQHKDGSYRWIEWRSYAEDGLIYAVARDITARKQAEAALRASEELFREAFYSAAVGKTQVDPVSGRFLRVNLAFCRFIGYPEAELLGKTFADITHAEDRAADGPLFQRLLRREIPAFAREKRYVRKDGAVVWGDVSVTMLFAASGHASLATAVIQDITARKQAEAALRESEERFASAFHTSPAAITITRVADGKFIDANRAFLDLFEFSREEVIGHTSAELGILSAGQRDKLIQTQIASGGLQNAELLSRSKSGRPVHLLFSSKPMRLAGEAHHVTTLIDITARKQAETRLRDTLQMADDLVQLIPSGMLIYQYVEPDKLYLLSGNPETEKLTGVKVAELIGQEFNESWPGAAASGLTKAYLEVMQTGRSFATDDCSYQDEKLVGAFRIRAFRLPNNRLAVSFENITAHKQAEAALREREERLRLLAEQVPAGIFQTNAEGENVFSNARWCELTGLTPEQARGKGWVGALHPEDRAAVAEVWAQATRSGGIFRMDHRLRTPEDVTRWVSATALTQRDSSGNVTGYLGTVFDITERKQADAALRESESRLRTIIESSPVAMAVNDEHGNITFLNRQFTETFGYTPADIPTVAEWWPRAYPDPAYAQRVAREWQAAVEKARRRGGAFEPVEYRVTGKDGIVRDILFTMAPMGTSSLVIFYDLTDRKRAEQTLAESREQLRALLARLQRTREEERTRVAREIHDELGQLLTGLKMDVRWLERKLSDPGLPRVLRPLLDRAVAASAMADTTIATVQKIAAELRPGALDQLGLAAALAQEVRRFQERSGVRCTLQAVEPVSMLPAAVAGELFYICQEALTNVARHARAARVWIVLRRENGVTVLEVRDDGVGMKETELNATGSLGLLGMRERTGQCGGTISFTRNKPRGTRVTVRIPVKSGA